MWSSNSDHKTADDKAFALVGEGKGESSGLLSAAAESLKTNKKKCFLWCSDNVVQCLKEL